MMSARVFTTRQEKCEEPTSHLISGAAKGLPHRSPSLSLEITKWHHRINGWDLQFSKNICFPLNWGVGMAWADWLLALCGYHGRSALSQSLHLKSLKVLSTAFKVNFSPSINFLPNTGHLWGRCIERYMVPVAHSSVCNFFGGADGMTRC